jgi:hypothetical protein
MFGSAHHVLLPPCEKTARSGLWLQTPHRGVCLTRRPKLRYTSTLGYLVAMRYTSLSFTSAYLI